MYSVAIDGPTGAGKSTIAKLLAKKIDCTYIDTGAMYRAVSYYCLNNEIDYTTEENIVLELKNINIKLVYNNGVQNIILNDINIEKFIRSEEISKITAKYISKSKIVREFIVDMQKEMANNTTVVMDGRDIGSKVLKNAFLKIYMSASINSRAKRRFEQLDDENKKFEDVLKEIENRDYEDLNRKNSPLIKCDDAIEIDTTNLSINEVVEKIYTIYKNRRNNERNIFS